MPATQVRLRVFHFPDDYEGVIHLWDHAGEGVHVGPSDTLEEIEKKLKRDPDLFLIAEEGEEIIGSVIGGYDGRRGMIYHLAVHPRMQKLGIGKTLLEEIEKRLQAKGCIKCYLLILAENTNAAHFYEHLGWKEMTQDRIFGKEF